MTALAIQLSQNFSLEEMTQTKTGLPNQPARELEMDELRNTAHQMEAVRAFLGHPIVVESGYRSPAVNMAVRGVPTSAHCFGYACDFVCPGYGDPVQVAQAIAHADIKFDQLIREYGWVHISFDPRMRGQCLTKRSADAPYEHGINA